MAKTLAPTVRAEFAKRLKDIRVRSGFLRARYFARSLGIEENRYTRYERAEVEPSLTLIHRMCEILRVSPNELMGFADNGGPAQITYFAEDAPKENAWETDQEQQRPLGALAWRLASETIAIRSRHRVPSKSASDPLAGARETGKLFQRLEADPFGTVAEIVGEPALKELDAARKARFAQLIAAFTDGVTDRSSGGAPRR
jgi:transcriptional regulator with XRE-family HTH domain